MPRKPKPPLPNLHIEGLSTGQQIGLVDEFTGEAIAAPMPTRPPRTSESYQREKSMQRVVRTQNVLINAGMGKAIGYKPAQVEQIPAGKIKIAELNGQAVLVDKPSWRRL